MEEETATTAIESVATEGDKIKQDASTTEGVETTEQIEYSDFKVPDGVTLDADALTKFKTLAKELGIKQDKAQAFTDIAVEMAAKWAEAQQAEIDSKVSEAHQAVSEKQRNDWLQMSKTDKEIGGEKLNANLSLALKGMESVATPELIKALDETGIGNHPEMIKAFMKIEKLVNDDKAFGGGRNTVAKRNSIAKAMYPNMND